MDPATLQLVMLIATTIATLCASISAVVPKPKEDAPKVLKYAYMLCQILAFNVGKAQNKE